MRGMRVIAGSFRSRLLVSPAGTATRPTSDRLRETLFNILTARRVGGLPGCRFADLYAGTGAVGIEAISRGSEHVWFAEKAAPALQALRSNLKTLEVEARRATVEEKGTGALLAALGKQGAALDVVFVDPPYEAEEEYQATLALLGSGNGSKLFALGAVVAVEFSSVLVGKGKVRLLDRYGSLLRTRVYRQGESSLAFYEVDAGKAEPV